MGVRRRLAGAAILGWLIGAAAYWLDPRPLDVPVVGMARTRVHSSFGAPRDGGRRRHQGADLFAARGTPVVAAAAGVVVFRGTTPRGGRVVYTLGRRGVLCYYAHLDRWADGVSVGDLVAAGERLGAVGNTGNARGTRPHLHFETRPVALGLRAVDPVRLLGAGRGPGRKSSPARRSAVARSRAAVAVGPRRLAARPRDEPGGLGGARSW